MITYIFLAIFSVPFNVLAWLLAPVLPLFAKDEYGPIANNGGFGIEPRLPSWLSLFMTPDNSLYGDDAFKEINGKSYLSMVKWLIRNPAYGYGLRYIEGKQGQFWGDNTIKDNDGAKAGWLFVRAGGLFQFTWIKKIGSSRCIYCNFGWNIRALVDDNINPKPDPYEATFSFSPRLSGFRP
jgi:hypothetical protein